MDLNGATALVTGAGRGIGRAICVALAEGGADLIVTARTEAELAETAKLVHEKGKKAATFTCDITNPEQVREMAEKIEARFGGVDILVHNAGGGIGGKIADLKESDFEYTIELNLTSVFRLTKHLLPGMMERRCGHIVMIASTAARRGYLGGAAYCAAKFGLNGFAQALFYETRKSDVRVTTLFPSAVNTELIRSRMGDQNPERITQSEDVAHAVVAAVTMDDRASIRELEIWGTNP